MIDMDMKTREEIEKMVIRLEEIKNVEEEKDRTLLDGISEDIEDLEDVIDSLNDIVAR